VCRVLVSYKKGSVNRSKIYIKHKPCVIPTWTYPPPTLIRLSYRFTSASKPAAGSRLNCCLDSFRTSLSTSSSSENRLPPICELLYATNTFHRKQELLLYEYPLHRIFLPIKTHNWMLLFDNTLLKHGRHFDYWNQPLNMRMCVCYLHRHASGLCCYLVIHIENLITSITAVLLPCVTYLLTLPRTTGR
jgi:hypothetical protein